MAMFELIMSEDDLPEIYRGNELIARAMTKRDGTVLVDLLNGTISGLRDRLLDELNDAVENCFEESNG